MEQIQVKLQFDAEAHKYSDNIGTVYTSVTTVIHKYQPKFDSRYWSMYTALREAGYSLRPNPEKQIIQVNGVYRTLDSLYKNPINNYEVNQVINKWKELTETACDRGNEVHDYLENRINESKDDDGSTNAVIKPQLSQALYNAGLEVTIKTQHDLDKTNLVERYPAIYNRLLSYINMGCTIYAEKKIYSTQYGIAGMIDVLIVKGKQFAILDWKTNKDIMMFRSGYFKKATVNGKLVKTEEYVDKKSYLLAPLNTVEDCKGMIYSLQLSLYAFIMELWGYSLIKGGLEIFHIRPNMQPKLIKIDYKKEEIVKMLKHHSISLTQKTPTKGLFGIR